MKYGGDKSLGFHSNIATPISRHVWTNRNPRYRMVKTAHPIHPTSEVSFDQPVHLLQINKTCREIHCALARVNNLLKFLLWLPETLEVLRHPESCHHPSQ